MIFFILDGNRPRYFENTRERHGAAEDCRGGSRRYDELSPDIDFRFDRKGCVPTENLELEH
jgi:hypothetical protein